MRKSVVQSQCFGGSIICQVYFRCYSDSELYITRLYSIILRLYMVIATIDSDRFHKIIIYLCVCIATSHWNTIDQSLKLILGTYIIIINTLYNDS